jgi:soluble lytic murein transglycosylase-like protein
MRCCYFGGRIVAPLGAVLSALVLQALASEPALASVHSRAHHFVTYRHHARHHQRFWQADTVAPGIYGYAPSSLQNDNWNEPRWHDNYSDESHRNESRWSENGSVANDRTSARRRWHNTEQSSFGEPSPIDGMAASAASAAGVPVSLVERVIKRESGGNPRAVSRGNYGLMQIRLGTARAMGYSGDATGLLNAQTNMTYAVRYLAGAYRAAGGNENRAVALYARGYYGQAKAQGFSPYDSGEGSGFAAYQPEHAEHYPQFAEASDQPFGEEIHRPVYRWRHHRHHAA